MGPCLLETGRTFCRVAFSDFKPLRLAAGRGGGAAPLVPLAAGGEAGHIGCPGVPALGGQPLGAQALPVPSCVPWDPNPPTPHPNPRRYVEFSLQYIFGIGHTTAKAILVSTGVENKRTKVGAARTERSAQPPAG